MASSEARIAASKRNGALSKGPVSDQGKSISKRNSLKHGLTGAGIVLVEADAAEVERRTAVYARESNASGELGMAVARSCALGAVRMERAADQQEASLKAHVRQAEADFVAPEDASEAEAAQLKSEAVRAAMFDPSKEATLARKYEAASQRLFFRSLKELERMKKQNSALAPVPSQPPLGSFSQRDDGPAMTYEEFEATCAKMGMPQLEFPGLPPELAKYFEEEDEEVAEPRRR